jgi:hypothetical protein
VTDLQAKKLVAILLAAYPTARVGADGARIADVYGRMLEDLDVEATTRAIKRIIRTSRFLPTVAEIRAAALEVADGAARAPGDAWGDVLRAIGRYGANRTPGVEFCFADPLVARAVQSLGWRELCLSEVGYADRARFVELYAQLVESDRRERLTAGIPGASAPQLRGGTTPIGAAVSRALASGARTVH